MTNNSESGTTVIAKSIGPNRALRREQFKNKLKEKKSAAASLKMKQIQDARKGLHSADVANEVLKLNGGRAV